MTFSATLGYYLTESKRDAGQTAHSTYFILMLGFITFAAALGYYLTKAKNTMTRGLLLIYELNEIIYNNTKNNFERRGKCRGGYAGGICE